MLSSNSLQLFTLMMVLTMVGLNLCMANPVNKTSKEDVGVMETDRAMEDSKPETGAVFIKEEKTNKPASWETAK